MRAFLMTVPSSRLQAARKHCLKAAYHAKSFYSPLANVAEKSFRQYVFDHFYIRWVSLMLCVSGPSGSLVTY
jgi:hypothetical protein